MTKLGDFVKTICSGEATEKTVAERHAICDACDSKVVTEAGEYCGACGCPRNPISSLDRKLRFKALRCPLHKFGAEQP